MVVQNVNIYNEGEEIKMQMYTLADVVKKLLGGDLLKDSYVIENLSELNYHIMEKLKKCYYSDSENKEKIKDVDKYFKEIKAHIKQIEFEKCAMEGMFYEDDTNDSDSVWNNVKDCLPPLCTSVLVYCPNNKCKYCAYYDKGWYIFGTNDIELKEEVVAWRYLPEYK